MKLPGSFSSVSMMAAAAVMLLSSSSYSFTTAFQTPSPLTTASPLSSTRLESSVFDTGIARVPGRRFSGTYASDEHYDYRRGGRGSEYRQPTRRGRSDVYRDGQYRTSWDGRYRNSDYRNSWDAGYAGHRRREREQYLNRWEPRGQYYNRRGSDSWGNLGIGGGSRSSSWYDDTSFSGYDRYRGYRDNGYNRWNPRRKEYWSDRTMDSYGAPTVQGGTRRTFSKRGGGGGRYGDDQTVLELGTDGRPLYANVETWEGPDNTRASLNFYSQDGLDYGVRVLSGNRHGSWYDETTSVRNTGPMEYPMRARVDSVRNNNYYGGGGGSSSYYGGGSGSFSQRGRSDPYIRESSGDSFRYGSSGSSYGSSGRSTSFYGSGYGEYASSSYSPASGANSKSIQGGGATRHWQLSPHVESIRVELHSQGLPIMAKVELLQGPNCVKTLGEVYQEDGYDRPFVCVLDTGDGEFQYNKGTLQITNEGPMEFPITAVVEAHELVPYY
eukprot:CAMPEP_0168738374 /NCGR_PEP_ID=MMETSP0724-20121128/10897_1 /TAXON_ID=265536 /ORGANISM="Amphiprora sp., Strain CCMP467" /LENGTH=495 /DNA_ID=CAMNT_0008785709 /DNA_START=289 /DNA_END=1776 /DNA_ORIENTATION=-